MCLICKILIVELKAYKSAKAQFTCNESEQDYIME